MTAIAFVTHAKSTYSTMMADSLITSTQKNSKGMRMFGKGWIKAPRTAKGDSLEFFEQKINILGPDLAFCWTGDRSIALAFARDLDDFYSADGCKLDDIEAFFKSWVGRLAEHERKKIGIVCVAIFENEYLVITSRIKSYGPYGKYSVAHVGGSGSKAILNELANDAGEVESVVGAEYLILKKICRLNYQNAFSNEFQDKGFGGFFEATDMKDRSLTKISDILFTSVRIDARDPDQKIHMPAFFMKQDFFEGMTIIREISFFQPDDEPHRPFATHIALPIVPRLRESTQRRAKKLLEQAATNPTHYFFDGCPAGDFRAKYSIVQLNIEDDLGFARIPIVKIDPERVPLIRVFGSNDKMKIKFSKELTERISKVAQAVINKETGSILSDWHYN